jgi:AcrR family transcriptional regulator
MERKDRPVKRGRRYDASRRQEQARATRDHVVEVAWRRFLEDGYGATTIASIARRAGVSVDTIYKSFGGKPGLVRAIHERALAGDGEVHAEARSDALQTGERDAATLMRGIGLLATEVAPRAAPVLLLIRDAAASDAAMAALKVELDGQRLERMTHNAGNLRRAGHLRHDLTTTAAAEIMWTYSSPELYELLVIARGWTPERYGAFIGDALTAALLPTHATATE